ncbi:hypothetical protein C1H46_021755 [Malus baccata]|uniref:Uncharacterized protein n=1 Tax=Malus baccata TaxID=106549 RepID=A0A540M1L6_MALBA|nr:hypothetical protein C1H46_021755 [Malus baccata]
MQYYCAAQEWGTSSQSSSSENDLSHTKTSLSQSLSSHLTPPRPSLNSLTQPQTQNSAESSNSHRQTFQCRCRDNPCSHDARSTTCFPVSLTCHGDLPRDFEVKGEFTKQKEPIKIRGCRSILPQLDVVDSFLNRTRQQYFDFVEICRQTSKGHGVLVNIWEDLEPKTLATRVHLGDTLAYLNCFRRRWRR